jgi:hypothetical protein
MAQGRRRSVCASRIRGGALSSDPRADRGTGFWRGCGASGAPARPNKGGRPSSYRISKLFTRINLE